MSQAPLLAHTLEADPHEVARFLMLDDPRFFEHEYRTYRPDVSVFVEARLDGRLIGTQGVVPYPLFVGGKQLLYAQGANGYFCNGRDRAQGGWCQPGYPGTNPNPISNNSWGPHRDSIPQIILDSIGDVRFRDPRKDFYNNGLVINNSINVSGSLPMGGYNFGLSKLDQKGMFPGTKLDRINLNANLTASLTSHLSAATSVMYSNAENLTSGEGYSSFTRTIYQLPVTRDISQAWMPDGSPVMWGSNSPHLEWLSQNELRSSTTARWIASQQLALTIVPGVTLANRLGLDTYTDERLTTANERPWRTAAGQTSGSFSQDKIYRRQLDNNLTLNVDPKQLTPLGLEQFANVCLVCHKLEGTSIGPPLGGNPILVDRDALETLLRNGRGRMPAVGATWDDFQIDALVQYTRTLEQPGQQPAPAGTETTDGDEG